MVPLFPYFGLRSFVCVSFRLRGSKSIICSIFGRVALFLGSFLDGYYLHVWVVTSREGVTVRFMGFDVITDYNSGSIAVVFFFHVMVIVTRFSCPMIIRSIFLVGSGPVIWILVAGGCR